jgi:hypothetical protein
MKSRKLTLRKEMLLGLSLLLILAGAFEFAGHLQLQALARKADYARQVTRCERLFAAVNCTRRVDPATGQVSNAWKKAKDKFLAAVDNLSQVQSLDKNDKVFIQNIRLAWQGYESSLPHRTPAGAVAVRSVGENTLHQTEKTAEASLNKALGWTDFGLRVAVLIGSLIGVGIVLLIAKDIRSRLEEVRQQLKTVTQSQGVQAKAGATEEDELKLKAEQLVNAVAELNNFIGQNVAKNVPAEEKQVQEEEISVN